MILPRLGYDVRGAEPAESEDAKREAIAGASGEKLPDREVDGDVPVLRAVVGGDEVVPDRE
jgi:hypothetical protein